MALAIKFSTISVLQTFVFFVGIEMEYAIQKVSKEHSRMLSQQKVTETELSYGMVRKCIQYNSCGETGFINLTVCT